MYNSRNTIFDVCSASMVPVFNVALSRPLPLVSTIALSAHYVHDATAVVAGQVNHIKNLLSEAGSGMYSKKEFGRWSGVVQALQMLFASLHQVWGAVEAAQQWHLVPQPTFLSAAANRLMVACFYYPKVTWGRLFGDPASMGHQGRRARLCDVVPMGTSLYFTLKARGRVVHIPRAMK